MAKDLTELTERFRMVYPVERWVTGQALIDGAADIIATHGLSIDPPTSVDEAIELLMDFGEVEILQ